MLKSRRGICWTSNKSVNKGRKFEDQLTEVERAAWISCKHVIANFLRNNNAEN